MASPIFAFFSLPISPPQTPIVSKAPSMTSEPLGSNVTLFTHQDGKKFQVTIMRLDETVEVDSDPVGNYREEDWDSDDWDEDAEDLEEPAPQPLLSPQLQIRLSRALVEECRGAGESGADRGDHHRAVDDWDGDAQDLEEQPVAKWSERPDRPDWGRRQRDADVWRTRLGED